MRAAKIWIIFCFEGRCFLSCCKGALLPDQCPGGKVPNPWIFLVGEGLHYLYYFLLRKSLLPDVITSRPRNLDIFLQWRRPLPVFFFCDVPPLHGTFLQWKSPLHAFSPAVKVATNWILFNCEGHLKLDPLFSRWPPLLYLDPLLPWRPPPSGSNYTTKAATTWIIYVLVRAASYLNPLLLWRSPPLDPLLFWWPSLPGSSAAVGSPLAGSSTSVWDILPRYSPFQLFCWSPRAGSSTSVWDIHTS